MRVNRILSPKEKKKKTSTMHYQSPRLEDHFQRELERKEGMDVEDNFKEISSGHSWITGLRNS